MAKLFTPLTLRGLTVENRVAVSPMCQYSAVDGVPTDWHLVHLGQFAQSGPGLIIVEATGVEPAGRITAGCTGLWNDAQAEAFARIIDFAHKVGTAKVGIQLAHAGRKGSTERPWDGAGAIKGPGAWQTVSASAVPYLDWPAPQAMTAADIARVIEAFAEAARRAVGAGFELIEVHAAHGYLLHQFLSPLSNRREDDYGGSRENRMRFPLDVFGAVRDAVPADMPVTLRLSASDWVEGGWDLDDALAFAAALKAAGCDLIDVTSGGLHPAQTITAGPGYQTHFAAEIRREAGIATMAVGQITDPVQAETIIATGQADMVALARAMLWDPRWVWHAAQALGAAVALPSPYARAHPSARANPFLTRA